MVRLFTLGTILTIGLLLSGCYTDFGSVVADPDPQARTPLNVASRIQAGDRIKLSVYGEETLSGVYDVSPAGTMSLPLVGTIDVVGRTRAELERQIARRISSYVKDPKVTVTVNEFRPIYMMGEVLRPGEYAYRSGLNALTAVSTAGGLTYRANKSTVLVQHTGEEVWHEYPLTAAVLIAPGDLIRVTERYF